MDGLTEPLWDATSVPYQYTDNAMFVRDYTIKLLGTSFPNMTATEVYDRSITATLCLGCAMGHHKTKKLPWTGDQVC